MRVIILGSGGSTGVPQIGGADGFGNWGACSAADRRNRRTRSSIVLEETDTAGNLRRVLVDTSPDLRAQALACGIGAIDGVVFTHAHADHIMGLDEIRLFNRIAGHELPAFGTQTTLDEIGRRFDYAFRPPTPPAFFRPALTAQTITAGDRFSLAGFDFATFDQDHHVTRTLGLRVGGFGYSTDVVRLDEAGFAALNGVDTWLVGCFQREAHMTHAHLDLVLAWHARLRPRRTVLTHLGPDMDFGVISACLPDGVEMGWDGLVLDLAHLELA